MINASWLKLNSEKNEVLLVKGQRLTAKWQLSRTYCTTLQSLGNTTLHSSDYIHNLSVV